MGKSYVGDFGTRLRLTTLVDMTDLSGAYFRIQKPDTTEVQWPCTVEHATSGIVYYDTLSGDFTISGLHKVVTDITLNLGAGHWSTEPRSFMVFEVFD
jgi:hypothetical protein